MSFRKFSGYKTVRIWSLLFQFLSITAIAQQEVHFDHLNMDKGLSQNSVISIVQDKYGFMWMGTRHGLNRYDGYRFKTYKENTRDTNSIKNDYINVLLKDSRGTLWVGTDYGLSVYDYEHDTFIDINNQYRRKNESAKSVTSLLEDRSGQLWVGTESGLLLLKHPENRQFTEHVNATTTDLPGNNIRCLYQDVQGNIWVGTSTGLCRIIDNNGQLRFQRFYHTTDHRSLSDNYITSLVEDKDNQLWIGTQNGGLNLYNDSSGNFITFRHSLERGSIISDVVRKLALDNMGKLWIGTLEGLSIMDTRTGEVTSYRYDSANKKSLSQNSVYSIYKDKNGSMWVGTYYGGINISYPYVTRFISYQKNNYLPSINCNIISSLLEDKKNNFWIGTEGGGLNYYNRKTGKYKWYLTKKGDEYSIGSNLVKTLYLDHSGILWVGTHGGGLNSFETTTDSFKRYLLNPAIPETLIEEINTITEDEKGQLWIGTQKSGIVVSNVKKNKFSQLEYPLINRRIKGKSVDLIFMDGDDTWIATINELLLLNRKTKILTVFNNMIEHANSLGSNTVNCLTKTRDGELWFGTYYGGVSRYDKKQKRFITYTTEDGLCNNNVIGIEEDSNGHLWLSTGNGLSSFDRFSHTFRNYNTSDGLPGNEFNKKASFRSLSGELFFGGFQGFVSFFANKILTNTKRDQVIMTGLRLLDKPVTINGPDHLLNKNIGLKEHLNFGHNQNTFTLEFALLNFIKPEKNRYAYKLEGYDKTWSYVSTPYATYTNLPAGTYTFFIKGINNDGTYSKNIRKLTITVSPPFYQSWWAYVIYTCCIASLAILVVRYLLIRVVLKKEKEVNAHKLEFFTNISHEIRTPLTLIFGPLEKLINMTTHDLQINNSLRLIRTSTDRLHSLVNELLDFRKIESGHMVLQLSKGDIVVFCKEIFLAFQNLALSKNIRYSFEPEEQEIACVFDPMQLEKVLFNLLSNAIKFCALNGIVNLSLKKNNITVTIEVSNTGKGIPTASQPNLFNDFYQINPSTDIGTGLGLSLSKRIVELHQGTISFLSIPAEDGHSGFTCFKVSLPADTIVNIHQQPPSALYRRPESAYSVPHAPIVQKRNARQSSAGCLQPFTYTILLAEDHDDIRQHLSNTLGNDYEILEAENGLQAWETAATLLPDLVISDIMMPGMDGLELCRKIKTDERTSHISVILLTARSAYIHEVNGLETGADAYISKPFTDKLLRLKIQNMLSARENLRKKFAQIMTLEPKNLIVNKTEQNFLNKIIQIIEDNMAEPDFGVPILAIEIGMSKPVLYKKIRSLTDLSVNDLIKSLRLKKAAKMLQNPNFSIAEVAYAVGFSDRKYFSLEFKKMFGKTPTIYISENQDKIHDGSSSISSIRVGQGVAGDTSDIP